MAAPPLLLTPAAHPAPAAPLQSAAQLQRPAGCAGAAQLAGLSGQQPQQAALLQSHQRPTATCDIYSSLVPRPPYMRAVRRLGSCCGAPEVCWRSPAAPTAMQHAQAVAPPRGAVQYLEVQVALLSHHQHHVAGQPLELVHNGLKARVGGGGRIECLRVEHLLFAVAPSGCLLAENTTRGQH